MSDSPRVIDLGSMAYADAYAVQLAHHEEVLAARESGAPEGGRVLLVEHNPPVITMTRRAGVADHLIATDKMLKNAGVTVADTDRGGDITYHGPGQLVAYPILDLNVYHLRLHDYMRLLEQAVIDTIGGFGVQGIRDKSATGVWVPRGDGLESSAKICAMGVRIRRWVSMHGLALNVTTNLQHFQLIVPCGLAGRPVTSLHAELQHRAPSMDAVKAALAAHLSRLLIDAQLRRPPVE